MKAVIIAGGQGVRLRPFTTFVPKALVPIGDEPMISWIIQKLKISGISELYISVGHLAELIEAFCGDGCKFGVKINYIRDPVPLGTIGPLSLLREKLNETFVIVNCDVLTDADINKMIEFHKQNNSIFTLGLTNITHKISYGVIEKLENDVVNYNEKPEVHFPVSMGLHVLEPEALKYIPDNTKIDLPDFIMKLVSMHKPVKGYLHEGLWLDIGLPRDYDYANENFVEIRKKILGE